jgi:hypothetical protein
LQGRGVEGLDAGSGTVTLFGGDYVGAAAVKDIATGSPPPTNEENAASISFCEVFVLARRDAIGLLHSLSPELRKEWISVTSHHAEGVIHGGVSGTVMDDEEVGLTRESDLQVESGVHEISEDVGFDTLREKLDELRRKEHEISTLREEVLALLSKN